jgi:hypothetical protein
MNTTIRQRFYHRQGLHLIGVVVIAGICFWLADWERLRNLSLLGVRGNIWFIASILSAGLHQFYVWYMWRSELLYNDISRRLGNQAFLIYAVGFGIFFFGRILILIGVGILDAGSLPMHWTLRWVLAPILFLLFAYTSYSVFRFFGYKRAAGADHFIDDYRHKPFEKRGIFRYTSNGMYLYAMLGLWVLAIWTQSYAALLGAFNFHAAIWLHYYCTEKPDMQMIYGTLPAS